MLVSHLKKLEDGIEGTGEENAAASVMRRLLKVQQEAVWLNH
jgi:hypothetical protein